MDLTDGLAELDLDSLSIEDLTPAQRRDFERAVVDGRLGGSLEAWVPWWEQRDVVAETMALPEDIPSLTELTGKPPHPELTAHAVELLFAYAYTMRRHNGEFEEDPLGVANMTMELSGVLAEGGRPNSVSVALSNALARARAPSVFNSNGFSFGVLRDVQALTASAGLVQRAMAELHGIHLTALPRSPKPRAARKAIVKKLFFFLAWARECAEEAAPEMQHAVTRELERQNEAFEGGQIQLGQSVTVPTRTAESTGFLQQ